MSPTDPALLSATELVALYRAKKLSPVEATKATLARIERFNPVVNAYCHLDADGALAAARESEARWAKGTPKGRVDGVPIGRQGQHPGCRHARALRLAPDARHAAQDRCAGGCAAERAGRGDPRQDRHAGVRLEGDQRQPAHRPHAQPVGHAHDHRRLVGRRGGGVRARHGRAASGHRRRRLDPHPGRVHGLLRPEVDPRPRPGLPGLAARHIGAPRTADAHGRRHGSGDERDLRARRARRLRLDLARSRLHRRP